MIRISRIYPGLERFHSYCGLKWTAMCGFLWRRITHTSFASAGGVLAALTLCLSASGARAQMLVENSLETRFQIDLKVPDAALNSFFREGLQPPSRLHRPHHHQRPRWQAHRQGLEPSRLSCGARQRP